MELRRRAGIAAALIGIGLALYRPRLVPELRPGTRGAPRPPAAALAAAIAWPPAPGLISPLAGSDGAALPPDADEGEEEPEEDLLRDAPADRASFGVQFPAGGAAPVSALAEFHRGMTGAPSSAETDLPRSAWHGGHAGPAPRPEPGQTVVASGAGRIDAAAKAKRATVFTGPAAPPSGEGPATEARAAVDPRRAPAASTWFRRPRGGFPLFSPPRRDVAPGGRSAQLRRKARPLLLSKLLGRGALRPPPSSIAPPDLSALDARRPLLLPGGRPTPTRPYDLDRIEAQDPRRAGKADRKRGAHWDAGPVWHDGTLRGLTNGEGWLWLWKERARIWAAPVADSPPLLRHQGLWWSKQKGVWFALHDGELWSWRRFSDWEAEGLIRLGDGVELIYSADFTKVAVLTPGAGGVLYDAATGAELGEWLESELPRRRPKAPSSLRLPHGI